MARIRTIKPTFFTSLTIADLTVEQRLTFIGLWTHVDDEGRCIYDPRLIKAALWPLDDRTADDVDDDIRALTESSLITHYTVGDRSYLHVNTWDEHQRINRKTPSNLPAPEEGQIVGLTSENEDSLSPHGVLTEDVHREGNKEGKGKEGASAPAPAPPSRFDDFWNLYPRKVGKDKARTAYTRAVKRVGEPTILDGVHRLANDPNLPDEKQYIPHPTTWLNEGRWNDEPYPPRLDRNNGRPAQETLADRLPMVGGGL